MAASHRDSGKLSSSKRVKNAEQAIKKLPIVKTSNIKKVAKVEKKAAPPVRIILTHLDSHTEKNRQQRLDLRKNFLSLPSQLP